MSKRSVNFTGRKPMKANHILSMMEWLGMTEEEIRAAVTRQRDAHPFTALRDMVYTECPCGCGAKEVCEVQRARVKANDDRIPF